MSKVLLFATLLMVQLLILGACGSPPPSVKIHSSQGNKNIEIRPNGQKIALWTEATPANVSFKWILTGSGDLIGDTDPSIQYAAPLSEEVKSVEDVNITVTITDTQGTTASDQIVIRLNPSLVAASVTTVSTDTPVPLPATSQPLTPVATSATSPTETLVSPSVTILATAAPILTPTHTVEALLDHFTGTNACPGLSSASGSVRFSDPSNEGLQGSFQLNGLEPNRSYLLSLNEQESFPGELSESRRQDHIDFQRVRTDSNGSASGDIDTNLITLPPREYHLKFLVKDPATVSYCVVLNNNQFEFTVR